MSRWKIPLSDLDYGPEETAAVLRVLESRWLSMGPEVEAFEREFAAFTGTPHAFGTANGTAALHLAFLALGIGPGDEVIQPAVNFVASANMTMALGATPVFADVIGDEEPTIDPRDIERMITERTRAVVVMHYGGYPCRMAEILEICRRRGLAVIEDACHAVGARYLDAAGRPPHGLRAGALGDIACFSFFSNKNMAMGEGGMVTCGRADLAERVRLLRSHGMTTLTWDRHRGHASTYDVRLNGYNYRMDELHGALGRVQLSRLEAGNRNRAERASEYRGLLAGLAGVTVPFAGYSGDSARHLMSLVPADAALRSRIVAALQAAGIQTSLHYPCIPGFAAFARFQDSPVPRSRAFAERIITLPLFARMSAEQVRTVCSVVRGAVETPPGTSAG